MNQLNISLFGRFSVEYEGKPFSGSLESRKVQELFSYLLLYRGRQHPREALADILWGENSGVQARKYLRQALWQLQSALKTEDEDSYVIVDADWVGINTNAGIQIDVAEFEDVYAKAQGRSGEEIDFQTATELVSAVELHRGSLLDGWYHDWCIFERERFQGMYLAMLNKLMMYFESRQEYEAGLQYGRRILQSDRAHERTHWRMMRLHYLAGDRTAALRQFERCATALEEELGVKPARWTLALYEQIRADELQEPTLVSETLTSYSSPAQAAPLQSASVSSVNFNKLQALIHEFNSEVQQYLHTAALAPHEQPEADL